MEELTCFPKLPLDFLASETTLNPFLHINAHTRELNATYTFFSTFSVKFTLLVDS